MENLRHAQARGKILQILFEDYAREMTSTRNLIGALDLVGLSISEDSFAVHMTYLEQQGYIRVWRTQDMHGFRRDRLFGSARPDDMRFAKLLPKGLQLVDGECAEDPKVKF